MIQLMVSQWSHLVGALLSLPCLLLIILIYCFGFSFIRMPRKSKHSLINILLLITSTITLFTVSLTLPVGKQSSSLSTTTTTTTTRLLDHHCLISSTLVNFSTISCLLWMLLSAFSMYQSLNHSAHEISSTINSTSTSSSSNNNNCTKSSSTDDNNEDAIDDVDDEIEPEPNQVNDNDDDVEEDDDDINLKIPPDLPLQPSQRSSYHHHHHHHHQYHPSATLPGSGKRSSSVMTILTYYLIAYGLSIAICITCYLINTNKIGQQSSTPTTTTPTIPSPPPWNHLKSTTTPTPTLTPSTCYHHVTLMTPTDYAITYGPIVFLFCLNLIVYLIVACILSCLGTNIVSPKGSTLQHHQQRYHAANDHHESSTIKPHGLTNTDGNQSIKVDLEWTYRRQLFAQIGLFILFTNLIVSMIFLVSWRPFSFVNHHHHHLSTLTPSTPTTNISIQPTSSSSIEFPIAEASISSSSEMLNGSSIGSSIGSNFNIFASNFTESIPIAILTTNNSYTIPLPSAVSSSSPSSHSSSSTYLPSSSVLPSTNVNAFQMDQLFYGLIYSLSSFLIASYLMILYVARRSDVRILLSCWIKGSNGGRRGHNQYNQYNNNDSKQHHHHHHHPRANGINTNHNSVEVNRGFNWLNCCFSRSVRELPLMPKVDVIRSSNSHSSQSTDHHLFSTTTTSTNYHHHHHQHHHLAQALLQSANETSTLTSSSSLVNAKLLLNNIDETSTTINGKELAHGLVYEEIKSTHNGSLINLNNSSRIASIHSINKSNNKLINNISSNCQLTKQKVNHHNHHHQQPKLIESTSSTPLITLDYHNQPSSQINYHLDYHEANHEVFINPKLNAIAKKFFEKNRRKQQQQSTNYNDKNDLDTKNIQSITRSTSSFKSDTTQLNHHHHHPLTASIFSNRPRLSFDNGYHSNGHPKVHHHSGSASVVGVPMSRSSGFTNEISDLISRLHPPPPSSGKTGIFPPPPSVTNQPLPPLPPSLSRSTTTTTTTTSKAKSDIACWTPSPSFLAKWQGPRSNPPPLPPLPTRKELMSTGRGQNSPTISTVTVGIPRRPLPNPQLTASKDAINAQQLQDLNLTVDNNLTSGLRVKLSNRKLPTSPSNLHKTAIKSSSSIPGALDDDGDEATNEILSVCCGSEVMSTVSVPWSCYSKRTAPPFLSSTTANTGPGDSHLHRVNSSSTGSSSCLRYHCHSQSQTSHSHHNNRSHHSNGKRSTSRSHHRSNHHCNRCWDVYFCDICDHCPTKSSSNRRRIDELMPTGEKEKDDVTGNKEHLVGHLPILRSSSNLPKDHHHHHHQNSHRNNHHHHHHHLHSSLHNSPTINATTAGNSSLNKKNSSLHDVNTPPSNSDSIVKISGIDSPSSNLPCYPRKPGSTVSSNGVERRRRRKRKSNQCKNRSSQGSTGHHSHSHHHHHHRGSCKHLPRSTSVSEHRSCNHCYNEKHQHYSSSDSQ